MDLTDFFFLQWLNYVIHQSTILTTLLCENFVSSFLWIICNQLTLFAFVTVFIQVPTFALN